MATKSKPATNSPVTNSDDDNEFAALKTLDAIAAFLFAKHSEQVVREAFKADDNTSSESLTDAAEELEARDFAQVAAIPRHIAKASRSVLEFLHLSDPMDTPSSRTDRVRFATVPASRARRSRTPPEQQLPPLSS